MEKRPFLKVSQLLLSPIVAKAIFWLNKLFPKYYAYFDLMHQGPWPVCYSVVATLEPLLSQ